MGSSRKKVLMEEFVTDEGEKVTRSSGRSKQIIKEQGDVEAFEILELSNIAQC